MSARQTRNQDLVLVGSTATITSSPADANALADGEIRLFTPEGVLIDNSNDAADMDFVIAMGGANGKAVFVSEVIDGSKLATSKDLNTTAGASETLESQYIGYNASTGSIEAIDNNLYMVQVYLEDYLTSSHDGRYIKHFQYKSDSTAAQSEIALGLAGSGVDNFNREAKNSSGDAPILFKALCNEGVTTANCFDNNATVVKGSNTFTVATNLQYNSGAGTAVAGDFVRLGGATGAVAATALGSAVYKIVSINSLEITVDRPIAVTSGSYTAAGNMAEVITAAEGAAANWGVFVEASTKDHVTGKEFYNLTRFNLNAKDFGTTTMPSKTAGVLGVGVAKAVADHEWFANGNRGEHFRMGEPAIHTFSPRADKATPLTYNITRITYSDSHLVGFQDNVSPKSITLYTPNATETYMEDDTDGTWIMLQTISGLATLDFA